MTMIDALQLFGLFIIFLGIGLLLYAQLLGILLRLHIEFFPKLYPYLHKYHEQLQIEKPEQ